MTNLAEKYTAEEAFLETGTIIPAAGQELTVDLGGRRQQAQRATMCLVEPEPGDQVLVASLPGTSFVLGVLSRPGQAAPAMTFDGDVDLAVHHGKLRVTAQAGVDVVTPGTTTVDSERIAVRASEGEAMVGKLRWLGTQVEAKLAKLTTVAAKVDAYAERFAQRVKRYYRFVEEQDQVRAEHLDHRARGTARVHAQNTVVTADKLAKVDADQVHIG